MAYAMGLPVGVMLVRLPLEAIVGVATPEVSGTQVAVVAGTEVETGTGVEVEPHA